MLHSSQQSLTGASTGGWQDAARVLLIKSSVSEMILLQSHADATLDFLAAAATGIFLGADSESEAEEAPMDFLAAAAGIFLGADSDSEPDEADLAFLII